MEPKNLKDIAAERTVIGTIINLGKNAIIDTSSILSSNDFSYNINRNIFTILEQLSNDDACEVFDNETILLKAKQLGLKSFIEDKKTVEYLDAIKNFSADSDNLSIHALAVRKLSIYRGLYSKYTDNIKLLEKISGSETISDVLDELEKNVNNFIAGTEHSNLLDKMGSDIENYVQHLVDSDPVAQIGLPTGYPLWDKAIGGGLRKASIYVVVSRSKVGKSAYALNNLRNVSYLDIPVLYLDTEMNKKMQQDRLLGIDSGIPIEKIETSQFRNNQESVKILKESGERISKLPITYISVSGMTHTEAMMLARRWLIKEVGFKENGEANDCLIVYDYMKLTSGEGLTKHTPEYILLGLMLTDLHNFANKYSVPILGFVQANREGIDNDDSGIIAGSDRIFWLCSSMSLLRNKTEQDVEQGSQWAWGNKKISIIGGRFGTDLDDYDYINLHASLWPRVTRTEGTGLIREGFKHSELIRRNVQSTNN